MSRLTSFALLSALVVTSFSLPLTALACKCMVVEPPAASEDATAVFEGRVTGIVHEKGEGVLDRLHVTLQVVRTWKGLEREERVEVLTNTSGAACGYTFAEDASYLVYAREHDGKLSVSSCSRTRPLADAADDLAFLGAGSTPVAIGTDTTRAGDKAVVRDAGAPLLSVSDGGVPHAATAPTPLARPRTGGCASGRSHASLSWLLALPALAMMLRRRRR